VKWVNGAGPPVEISAWEGQHESQGDPRPPNPPPPGARRRRHPRNQISYQSLTALRATSKE